MVTRPATGSLKMPVTTVRPFQTTALGNPTLTDTTCNSDDGCICLLLFIPQSLLHPVFRGAVRCFQGVVPAKTQRLSSQRAMSNDILVYSDLDLYINDTID